MDLTRVHKKIAEAQFFLGKITKQEALIIGDKGAVRLLPKRISQCRLMGGTPELQSDLRVAAIVLRAALAIGFPVRPIDINGAEG